MSWLMLDRHNISHIDGAQINLVVGLWENPVEIKPQIPNVIGAGAQTHLIHEGLYFAWQNSRSIELEKEKS